MKNVFLLILLFAANLAQAQVNDTIQIPPLVQAQLQSYQDRFEQILQEECPGNTCSAVGCQVVNFLTLDEQQSASLPGLESTEEKAEGLQYRLSQVRCEFAHEPTLTAEALTSLKQRINSKAKQSGTSLSLVARKLNPRHEMLAKTEASALTTESTSNWSKVLPWIALVLALTLAGLAGVWGWRRLGKNPEIVTLEAEAKVLEETPAPSVHMIMSRVEQLRTKMKEQPAMAQAALKPLLQTEEVKDLCIFLKHFGAEHIAAFNSLPEYHDTLLKLRDAYQKYSEEESPANIWKFLDRIERYLTASEIGQDRTEALETFSFIKTLAPEEFKRLLERLSEPDLSTTLSVAPPDLQKAYFRDLPSEKVEKLIEGIARTSLLPDGSVRDTAARVREVYESKFAELKTVPLDRIGILEQALGSMDSAKRLEFLRKIGSEQKPLLTAALPNMFLDESLAFLPSEVLDEVFLAVPPEVAAQYLDTLAIREDVLNRLKSPLANAIRRHSRAGIGLNLSDNEFFVGDENNLANNARTQISNAVREKSRKGLINLKAINERILEKA